MFSLSFSTAFNRGRDCTHLYPCFRYISSLANYSKPGSTIPGSHGKFVFKHYFIFPSIFLRFCFSVIKLHALVSDVFKLQYC